MSHCNTKWAVFLMSLKSLIETGKEQPSPDDLKSTTGNDNAISNAAAQLSGQPHYC